MIDADNHDICTECEQIGTQLFLTDHLNCPHRHGLMKQKRSHDSF